MKEMEKESQEEADNRREAAIASSASLRPNFKPKNGITDSQLSKFQELHKRRLQIKAKSKKEYKKSKAKGLNDGNGNSKKISVEHSARAGEEPSRAIGDSPTPSKRVGDASAAGKDSVTVSSSAKRPQKLYWGLDAKERWERKSNM